MTTFMGSMSTEVLIEKTILLTKSFNLLGLLVVLLSSFSFDSGHINKEFNWLRGFLETPRGLIWFLRFGAIVRRSPPRHSPPQTFTTSYVHHPLCKIRRSPPQTFTTSDVHHPRRSPPQTFTTPSVKSDVHHPRRSPPQTFTTSDVHHLRRSPPPL